MSCYCAALLATSVQRQLTSGLSPEHICIICKSGPITRCIHHSNRALMMRILLSLMQTDRRAGLGPSSAHARRRERVKQQPRAPAPINTDIKDILVYIVNYLTAHPKRHRGAPEGPVDGCRAAFCCDVISV